METFAGLVISQHNCDFEFPPEQLHFLSILRWVGGFINFSVQLWFWISTQTKLPSIPHVNPFMDSALSVSPFTTYGNTLWFGKPSPLFSASPLEVNWFYTVILPVLGPAPPYFLCTFGDPAHPTRGALAGGPFILGAPQTLPLFAFLFLLIIYQLTAILEVCNSNLKLAIFPGNTFTFHPYLQTW